MELVTKLFFKILIICHFGIWGSEGSVQLLDLFPRAEAVKGDIEKDSKENDLNSDEAEIIAIPKLGADEEKLSSEEASILNKLQSSNNKDEKKKNSSSPILLTSVTSKHEPFTAKEFMDETIHSVGTLGVRTTIMMKNDSSSAASNNCSSHKNNTTPSPEGAVNQSTAGGNESVLNPTQDAGGQNASASPLDGANATQGNSSASPNGNSTENASAPQTNATNNATGDTNNATGPANATGDTNNATGPANATGPVNATFFSNEDAIPGRGGSGDAQNQSVVLDNVSPPNNNNKNDSFQSSPPDGSIPSEETDDTRPSIISDIFKIT